MTASLDNTTITINYEGVSSKTYNFDFNSPKLTTIINILIYLYCLEMLAILI